MKKKTKVCVRCTEVHPIEKYGKNQFHDMCAKCRGIVGKQRRFHPNHRLYVQLCKKAANVKASGPYAMGLRQGYKHAAKLAIGEI